LGKNDSITKKYMRQNDRFADVCNYYLFDGESVVKADELEEKDITELAVIKDKNSKVMTAQRFRDILKNCIVKSANGVTYMLIGIENQTDINYAMVIKNMVYDALNYATQAEQCAKRHRDDKDLEGAEFLAGFAKNDKLMPVITITIYWNSGKWDGSRSLHEMLDVKDKNILEYVSDYKLNLVVPNDIDDFDKFNTELGKVFNFISYSEDKDQIRKRFYESESNEESMFSADAITLLNECVKANLKTTKKKGGKTDVCKGIKDLVEEEKKKSRIEGESIGEIRGEDFMATLVAKLLEDNRMSEVQKISSDKELREELYKEYGIK